MSKLLREEGGEELPHWAFTLLLQNLRAASQGLFCVLGNVIVFRKGWSLEGTVWSFWGF